MLFTGGPFLFVFLPATLVLYFGAARWLAAPVALFLLGVASLVFYAQWQPVYLILLLGSIATNYFCAHLLWQHRSQSPPKARWILALGVTANLGVLLYFKYADFLLSIADQLFGPGLPLLRLVLPLGISFFTFTQIAFLVDVYAGKAEERSPVNFLLFVTYFPHLIAGPVLHHSEMMPQFARPEIGHPRLRNFAVGMLFFLLGIAKKTLIADSVAPTADQAFAAASTSQLGFWQVWAGVACYTLQIYFDFSGYSDMAVGLSRLFGVRLPFNFHSPYKSRNLIEFWRRWHMTLSRFLRDYLYIPLGGGRKGPLRRYINLLATMLLGGLWHGAALNFVIWGALHGVALAINHGWQALCDRFERRLVARWYQVLKFVGRNLAPILTLVFVMTAWVFFRAESTLTAERMLTAMFVPAIVGAPPALSIMTPLSFAGILAVLFLAPNSQEFVSALGTWATKAISGRHQSQLLAMAVGVELIAIVLVALVADSRGASDFIYFNF
jgi:D-alanyl-lipoteichoic acid acyltransferase DltB (MBOAT superfamily)